MCSPPKDLHLFFLQKLIANCVLTNSKEAVYFAVEEAKYVTSEPGVGADFAVRQSRLIMTLSLLLLLSNVTHKINIIGMWLP